jgi:hypothetical protein
MSRNEAEDLLNRAVTAYRAFTSYSDDGFVEVSTPKDASRHRTNFETLFASPRLFRFKFESPHPHPPLAHLVMTAICGFDGSSAYLWMSAYGGGTAKFDVFDDVVMAIASATGISSGSAHTIGQLLLAGYDDDGLASLKRPVLASEEQVDGKDCVEVRGTIAHANSDVSLFIDHETFLIRKVTSHLGVFTSHEFRRNIHVNEPIDHSKFAQPDGET